MMVEMVEMVVKQKHWAVTTHHLLPTGLVWSGLVCGDCKKSLHSSLLWRELVLWNLTWLRGDCSMFDVAGVVSHRINPRLYWGKYLPWARLVHFNSQLVRLCLLVWYCNRFPELHHYVTTPSSVVTVSNSGAELGHHTPSQVGLTFTLS